MGVLDRWSSPRSTRVIPIFSVVGHHGQVVSGGSVTPENHQVVDLLVPEAHGAVDPIIPDRLPVGYPEPNGEGLAGTHPGRDLDLRSWPRPVPGRGGSAYRKPLPPAGPRPPAPGWRNPGRPDPMPRGKEHRPCASPGPRLWKYGPSSQVIPSHRRPWRMAWVCASVDRSRSVSSMRSTKTPPSFRAKSQLKRAVLAPPTCRYPVGEGAKRTRSVMESSSLASSWQRSAARAFRRSARLRYHRLHLPSLSRSSSFATWGSALPWLSRMTSPMKNPRRPVFPFR